MALVPCTDLSPAAWVTDSDRPWDTLVTFGPAGLPAYARLRFIPDPAHPGQSENAVVPGAEHPSEGELLRAVLDVLADHTGTPGDCYVCLWDGWFLHLDGAGGTGGTGGTGPDHRGPAVARSFLDGPKVVVPHRAYYLFRGPLSDVGDRGAADDVPDGARLDVPTPAFVWPADHAWCVTKDVDPHWAGIGAHATAIERLVADDRLDVVRADPGERPPSYR